MSAPVYYPLHRRAFFVELSPTACRLVEDLASFHKISPDEAAARFIEEQLKALIAIGVVTLPTAEQDTAPNQDTPKQ